MIAIETDGLTKRYGDITAVDDLDLTVEEGEVFGFLGPNGAGKSTTINVLLGYMNPTGGSATILGHDIEAESRELRRRTGVLPENVSVYERLTGREHVVSAIRMKDVDDDPETLLSRVGLEKAARDRPAGEYSTGMAQRLAMATALAGAPDLLILDEPQNGLDPNGMQLMRDIVQTEAANGTTVFFSSHILPEVEAVSDRVGMMRNGRMAAVDTVNGLRKQFGGGTVVNVTMAGKPTASDELDGIDGVDTVTHDGHRVVVTCRQPRAKVETITALERTGRIMDFTIEKQSLEDLFTTITDGEETDEAKAPVEGEGVSV